VELARVLIVGLDAGGTVQLFNREAERVTGFARDEVLGKPFSVVLAGSSFHDEHGPLLARGLAGESVTTEPLEGVLCTRAGQIRDVRWQIAYAPSDDDPEEVVLFVIGRDVTDEKALAARLRQNEKLAAVGTLAAGLAHEIRNPLNGAQLHIIFLERGLRKKEHDADALEAVRVVSEEIKRLSALVSEFLDFARPKPLTLRQASLCELCGRIVQLMSPVALAAKATLSSELPRRI
jgi:PAS domain S-box-containing protein